MVITIILITAGILLFTVGIAFMFVFGYAAGEQAARAEAWISVKDGPPDSDEYDLVLAYVHVNDKIDNFEIIAEYVNGEWRRDVDYAKLSDLGMTVTHWAPLPEPPQNDNNIILLEV